MCALIRSSPLRAYEEKAMAEHQYDANTILVLVEHIKHKMTQVQAARDNAKSYSGPSVGPTDDDYAVQAQVYVDLLNFIKDTEADALKERLSKVMGL